MKKKLRLEPGEHVVVSTLAHPSKLLRPAIVLIVTVFLHGLLQRMLEVRWRPMAQPWTAIHTVLEMALSVLLVLVMVFAVLRPVLRWARTRFVLTDRRLMLLGGAAPRDGVRIPLAWLHHVDTVPTRWPLGLAGIGTLSVDFGQAGVLRLTHSPRVVEFGRLIESKAASQQRPSYANPHGQAAHGTGGGYGYGSGYGVTGPAVGGSMGGHR